MARITLYQSEQQSQTSLPSPRASGSDFDGGIGAAAGSGLQALGAELYKVAEEQEVTAAQANLAQMEADWTVHVAQAAQQHDANDPNFASKVMADFDKAAGKAGGGGGFTRAGTTTYARGLSRLRANMAEKAGLYQVQLAGERAVLDFGKTVDSMRNTVWNDPTAYDRVAAQLEANMADPSSSYSRMPGSARQKLMENARTALAQNAVQGLIRLDPTLAQKQLKDGQWNDKLDGDKINALYKEADTEISARDTAKRIKEAEALKARKAQQEAVAVEITNNIISGKGNIQRQILDADIDRADKMALFNFWDARAKEGPADMKTYGPEYTSLLTQIDSENPPTHAEIRMRVGKGLTVAGANSLFTNLSDTRNPEGAAFHQHTKLFYAAREQELVKDGLFGSTMFKDPKGRDNYAAAVREAEPLIRKLRAKGLEADEIFKKDGPVEAIFARYKRSFKEIQRDLYEANRRSDGDTPPAAAPQAPPAGAAAPAKTQGDARGVVVPTPGGEGAYKSADDVVSAFKNGKLSYDEAARVLREKGWAQ